MKPHASMLAVVLVALMPALARAQAPYVSAGLGADVLRVSHVEDTLAPTLPSGGEAWSWSLRTGVPLGGQWGVELEFERSAESTEEFTGDRAIPLTGAYRVSTEPVLTFTSGSSTISSSLTSLFPTLRYDVRVRQHHAALTPLLWFGTDITDKIGIVFLGGVAFTRRSQEIEYEFSAGLPLPGIFPPIAPSSATTVGYGTHPVAGVEARIALTEHVQLVPGVRLQGIGGGWMVRPAVGLGWQF